MKLYFSGSTSGESLPERVLYDRRPDVMLTYYEMNQNRGDTIRRFERHQANRKKELACASKSRRASKST